MAARKLRPGSRLVFLGAALASCAGGEELRPETEKAFERYVRVAEARIEARVRREGGFLFATMPERRASLRANRIITEPVGQRERPVPGGLIHDWAGGVFIRGVSLETVLQFVQAYDRHKEFYRREVIDSRLLEREENEFRIALRLVKRKVRTVVFDTEHVVRYERLNDSGWWSRSRSTRIAQVQNAGTAGERILPPDTGDGYLWRLNSYWTFHERDGGVYLECEAISLSRDVPRTLALVIGPIVRDLPKDSLVNALSATRDGLAPVRKR
jgi:hypothetical protein